MPPVEVQREIVRVLDLFASWQQTWRRSWKPSWRLVSASMPTTVTQLLAFRDARSRWVPMGEVGEFIRGRRFTKSDVHADGIGSIHYGEIYTHYGSSAATRCLATSRRLGAATTLRQARRRRDR